MKRFYQILMFLMIGWSALPALAEIDSAMLIGEWCLVHQSMLGHDFESPPPKAISDNLRAKRSQSYDFKDRETVEVIFADKPSQEFSYKIAGSKNNRIRIKRWQTFSVKSLTESEIRATVYGTVQHRFTRGTCESP